MIKGLELFAGIGGWKKALDNLKIENDLWPVELDQKTINVYDVIHNQERKFYPISDVKNINFINSTHNKVDVIFMSPPCQNYSKAKQCSKRETDNLISYTLPIIKKCMPRYVIVENVPQFKSSIDYLRFGSEMFGYGYIYFEEEILNPIDYNWPQNRPRFFSIWFRYGSDWKKFKWPEKEELILTCGSVIKNNFYQETHKWKVIPENAKESKAGNSIYWGKYIDNRCFKWSHFIGTITATFNQPMITSDTNVLYRKLSVSECFALMGVPYEIFLKIKEKYPKLSDSSLKRMAGNSLVVPLIEKILKNLDWRLDNEKSTD